MRVLTLAFAISALLPAFARVHAHDGPPPPRAGGAIGAIVEAVVAGNLSELRRLQEAAGPIGMRIATWRILRNGAIGDLSTYAAFERSHLHWPGMDRIRARGEARLAGQPAAAVLDWFATRTPQTTQGALALLAARAETGGETADLLREIWLEHDLSATQQTALMDQFGDALRPMAAARLEAVLWRGEMEQAQRLYDLVDDGQRALARARLALQNRAEGVDAMIAAVPANLAEDPGLAHDRFRWRLSRGLTDSAAELMRSVSPDGLGQPGRWSGQRARLARRAMQAGDHQLAYDLAANHGLTSGVRLADLEWLAGYIALRFLDRPDQARTHFNSLRDRVSSPISLGRAGYWEGRALDAMGEGDAARAAYQFGAQYQSAFYGQLAAERLGQPLDAALLLDPVYPDWRETSLRNSDVLEAALLLHRAGQWHEARRFVLHLASTLDTEMELGALAQLWLARGEPHFALKIAKAAVRKGILLPRAYFPLAEFAQADLAAPADLVLAIARRESEFNHRAISHADARGLMQVLPATGAHTARRLGVEFNEAWLTTNPTFNAMLGAGYLEELLGQFDGTLSLVAAGYNAGPGRPVRWMRENGDPRTPSVDPIDWVELIPFSETRNYVMRVTETVVIYRALLARQSGEGRDRHIGLTDILRGR